MKWWRTDTCLIIKAANHARDNITMSNSTLYAVFAILLSLPSHLMALSHMILSKAQLMACVFCVYYKNTLYVWSIFRLIKIADILKCLSLLHILDHAVSSSWTIVIFTKVKKFAHLFYLLPYSPDYNLIKPAFWAFKSYLCHHNDDLSMMAIVHVCQSITPDKAVGYFCVCGYIV